MNDTNVEIERRFLPTTLDWKKEAEWVKSKLIFQCYPTALQEKDKFVRIRETVDENRTSYELCIKGPSDGLSCSEDEIAISESEAREYFLNCDKRMLTKLRHVLCWKGVFIEVDQFQKIRCEDTKLVICEIEFETVNEAKAFEPPAWLGKEITGLHHWSNFDLCLNGIPWD